MQRTWSVVVALVAGCGAPSSRPAQEPGAAAQPARDPEASAARLAAGLELVAAGDRDGAADAFDDAIAKDPDNHRAHHQRGLLDQEQGDWDGAERHFGVAAKLAAREPGYLAWHGRALYETGSLSAAVERYESILASSPGKAEDYYYLGLAQDALGEHRLAASALTESAARDGCFLPAFVALAELYERWEFMDRARAVARLGVQCKQPATTVWRLWAVLGRVAQQRGQYKEAVDAFGQALAVQGVERSTLLLRRGLAFEQLGRFAEARVDLEAFLAEPDSAWNAENVRKKLRTIGKKKRKTRN